MPQLNGRIAGRNRRAKVIRYDALMTSPVARTRRAPWGGAGLYWKAGAGYMCELGGEIKAQLPSTWWASPMMLAVFMDVMSTSLHCHMSNTSYSGESWVGVEGGW